MDPGGAFPDVSVARFTGGHRRRRGPEIDQLRRPAGARVLEPPRPQVARFRADAKICDFRRHCRGSPEIGISGTRQDAKGAAARFATSSSRVLQGVPGENGVRKLTTRADRRGPAFESRPAPKSPDFWPMRKSAISGDIVGEIRKSGIRDLARISWGDLLGSGGACSDVSVACFVAGFRRKLSPEADQLRQLAMARVLERVSGEN